jgi:hypothetical protein
MRKEKGRRRKRKKNEGREGKLQKLPNLILQAKQCTHRMYT